MITKDFALAGNSTFTISNREGVHYTFKMQSPKDNDKMFFVRYLFGPNNESDYAYAGITFRDNLKLKLTAKSKLTSDSLIIHIFDFAMRIISGEQKCPEGYDIQHSGKCGKCGRKLTTPESIEAGLGPVCGNRV